MIRDVHLHIVGDTPDSLFGAMTSGRGMDGLYLLDDRAHGQVLDRITDVLSSMGFRGTHIIPIDAKDYQGTFSSVKSIMEEERRDNPEVRFHVDISGGSTVSAVAVSNASMSFDSEIYYLDGGHIVSMESEALDEISVLRAKTRVLSTFLRFKGSDRISNKELMGDMSPSRLQYRTKALYDMGLIGREGTSREPVWVLTTRGRQVLSRF